MALFRRNASLFGGRSLFGRDRGYDREPLTARGGYYGWITPPSLPLFLIAAVLAGAAILFRYAHVDVPVVTAANAFDVLATAFAILVAGVLVPRL